MLAGSNDTKTSGGPGQHSTPLFAIRTRALFSVGCGDIRIKASDMRPLLRGIRVCGRMARVFQLGPRTRPAKTQAKRFPAMTKEQICLTSHARHPSFVISVSDSAVSSRAGS